MSGISEKYTKYKLLKVSQKSKYFYIAVLKIKDIKDLFTVSPAEYRFYDLEMRASLDDENFIDKFQSLKLSKNYGYQRTAESIDRMNQICEYISEDKDYHIIPNSIIMTFEAEVIPEDEFKNTESNIVLDEDKLILGFNKKMYNDDFKNKKPILVIDGNHRLLGIKKHCEESNCDFEIVATLLINIDSRDQAEQFKTVNYKIKPVSKSYYYQIMGEFDLGREEEVFLHYVARFLNENHDSPLFSRIKMLGRSYKADRKQTLSQSFIVEFFNDWLIDRRTRLIIPEDFKVARIPVLRYMFIDEDTGREFVIKIIYIFLKRIEESFLKKYKNLIDWDSESENKLLKPIGIGAFIELFSHIYIMILNDNNLITKQDDFETVYETYNEKISSYLEPLFSNDFDIVRFIEEFSSQSGQGTIRKVANALFEIWASNYGEYVDAEDKYVKWYEANLLGK